MKPSLQSCAFTFLSMLAVSVSAVAATDARSEPATPAAVGARAAAWSLANQMDNLSYQNICTAFGILKLAAITNDTRLRTEIETAYRRFLLEGEDPNRDNAKHPPHRWFALVPLELYAQTGDARYQARGLELAEAQYAGAGPDGMPAYTPRWFVDDIYGAAAMQSLAFRASGDEKFLERAVRQALVYAEKFQQPDGLFRHGPSSPFYWGRGNGWCAAALTEVLAVLPDSHPRRADVLEAYRRMMAALVRHQAPEGAWRQLIDDEGSWIETSGTAMFLFALARGAKHGWIPRESRQAAIDRAWAALASRVDEQGRLQEVCIITGHGRTKQHYLDRPRTAGDAHGQAGLLWAAAAMCALQR